MRNRILASALLVVAALAALPGCGVSLFSHDEAAPPQHVMTSLERRMDRIEERLPR